MIFFQVQYENIDPDRDFQSMEIIELLSEPTCSSLPLKRDKSNREIILYVLIALVQSLYTNLTVYQMILEYQPIRFYKSQRMR